MYLTIKETAELLDLPESYVHRLIQEKRIRALYDGEQYLLYKEQFNHHMEQMVKWKQLLEEENKEPWPEDVDVKDED